jgi:hypothetical protein
MGQGSENFKKIKMSVKRCLMQFDPKLNSRLFMNSYGLHHGIDDISLFCDNGIVQTQGKLISSSQLGKSNQCFWEE